MTSIRFATDEDRWQAVLARDPRADGAFYYSVRSTGVYCRPSCSSRRARRENVSFHPTREDAERAGFRPCRRCRPDQPPLAEEHAATVARACRRIEGSAELPSLEALAREAGMSRSHFVRVFKAVAGVTPKAYAAGLRGGRVREQLRRGDSVTDAIYASGFGSSGRFYATSAQMLGMAPSRFRDGGQRERIRFAVGQCSLGAILVAATDVGVCAILLGADPEELLRQLQDDFPRADLVGGDADFERLVARVVGFVEAPAQGLHLPLDLRGTAFQVRVWNALREIPAGATLSYKEIAERIGAPGAARAVARACAANRLAVAIPCHRVVRTDGTSSGYRWGIARRRALLQREA